MSNNEMPQDILCYSVEEAKRRAGEAIEQAESINIRMRRLGGYLLLTLWNSESPEPT
jgi:hypothetical protein